MKEHQGLSDIHTAIDDLIQSNYIVGAQSYLKLSPENHNTSVKATPKKRVAKEEDKKAVKDLKIVKDEDEHDFPVKINSLKMLAEERRKALVDFGSAKFHNSHS